MNKRQSRLALIVKLLLNNSIGSQEELMALLEANDCVVTQATLSRDLKTLRTSKVATELGGYRYEIAANGTAADEVAAQAMDSVRQAAIISVAFSGRQAVIKTRNGYAGGVAYDIDELSSPLILGTIAGADTVFVAVADNATRSQIYELLSEIIPANVMREGSKYFID
ncbi:MAG: arginine repressor [Barnesiella sp.]|nr:arginine repressor [Barnesiella sp.]MBD5255997.1 arginine repressor [Barnesiella sp.]